VTYNFQTGLQILPHIAIPIGSLEKSALGAQPHYRDVLAEHLPGDYRLSEF